MKVFITGATGFIGTAVTKELVKAGHKVLGLSRSEEGAEALKTAGAEVQHGSLEDLDSLRAGVKAADAVIHLAFNHDFSKFQANCEADRKVIEVLGAALKGTDYPMIVTSGTAIAAADGRVATEDDAPVSSAAVPRAASEEAAMALAEQGLNVSVMRLSQIHDPLKQGLVTFAIALAREKGVSAYIGEGKNRWAAAPIADTARLYRLVLEKGAKGARYHAVAEEGVSMREIAEVVGQGLKIPTVSIQAEKAGEHFGWLAMFAGHDMPASSAQTRERLAWNPTGPGLISDLEKMDYSKS